MINNVIVWVAYYVIHIITRAIVYNSSLYRVDFDLYPQKFKSILIWAAHNHITI